MSIWLLVVAVFSGWWALVLSKKISCLILQSVSDNTLISATVTAAFSDAQNRGKEEKILTKNTLGVAERIMKFSKYVGEDSG